MPAVNEAIALFQRTLHAERDCAFVEELRAMRQRAAEAAAKAPPRVELAACGHRGPVLTPCPCENPDYHVYHCTHPGEPEWTRCTPGLNNGSDPDIASCVTCPLHSSRAKT